MPRVYSSRKLLQGWNRPSSSVFAYQLAALSTLLIFVIRWHLTTLEGHAGVHFFLLSVAISSWFGGAGPAIAATILALILDEFYFGEQAARFTIRDLMGLVDVGLFVVEAGLMMLLIAMLQTSQRRAMERSASYTQHMEQARASASLATQALHAAEERTSAILESIHDAFVALDWDWRFTYANHRACELSERSPGDLIGRCLWDVLPQLRGTPLEAGYHRVMLERQPTHFEMANADGQRWFEVSVYPAKDGITAFCREISDRKRAELANNLRRAAERAERDSAAKFRTLYESNIVPLAFWQADGQITDANPAFLTMIGKSRQELEAGHISWKPLLSSPECSVRWADMQEVFACQDRPPPIEVELSLDDGQRRLSVLIGGSVLPEQSGYGLAFALDMSALKSAEQALRISEERLRFAQRCANAGTWDWEIDSGALSFSDEYFELFGLDRHKTEATYKAWLKMIHPGDRERVAQVIATCLHDGSLLQIEYRYEHPVKGLRWFGSLGRTVYNSDGRSRRMGGIVLDITAKKAAYDDRAQLSTIVETSSDAIVSEVNGVISSWNAAAEAMFGYKCSEMLGQPLQRLIPTHSLSTHDHQASAADGPCQGLVRHYEAEGIRRNGTTLWLSLSVSPIRDAEGVGRGVATIARDITEQKTRTLQSQFLAESAEVLSSSLDYRTTLANLAKISVPRIADWCVIYAYGDDGKLRQIALAHPDPAMVNWAETALAEYLPRPDNPYGIYQVLRDGKARLQAHIPPDVLEHAAHNGEHLRMLQGLRMQSFMMIPMTSKQQTYGVLTLISCDRNRIYQQRDLMFACELGRRAALAIENAKLYGQAQLAVANYEKELGERKRTEVALRLNERIYHTIGKAINYGIWICDDKGRNIYASESFLQLLGMTQQQCSEFGWWSVLHPSQAQASTAAWLECVNKGVLWDQELLFKGVDGNWHSILARGAPVRNENGEVIYWAGINLDISRMKQTEDELRIAKNEADAANAAKSAFLANMSHEIRTPLGAILGFSDLLAASAGDQAEWLESLAAIQRNGHLLSNIINDILDLSKVEAGRLSIEKSMVSLPALLAEVASSLNLQATAKGITLTVSERGPIPLAIITDPLRLKQILNNLIGNAIKFTAEGGVNVYVEVGPPSASEHALASHHRPSATSADAHGAETNADANADAHGAETNADANADAHGAETNEDTHADVHGAESHADAHGAEGADADADAHGAENNADTHADAHRAESNGNAQAVQVHGADPEHAELRHSADRAGFTRSPQQGAELLYVHITDSGTGIDPSYADKLFHPFTQADPSYARKHGGTGLGLALSRRLARLLGGDVVLHSTKAGTGSHFIASIDPGLPTASAHAPRFSVRGRAPIQRPLKGALKGLKILLVEDAPDNQLLMNRILTMAGAEVSIAHNGEQGVTRAAMEPFDVVLMDVQMPVMDGFEATTLLRQHGFAKPIIAITAHALKEERARCLASGFDDHISKPVDRQLLINRLADFTPTPRPPNNPTPAAETIQGRS